MGIKDDDFAGWVNFPTASMYYHITATRRYKVTCDRILDNFKSSAYAIVELKRFFLAEIHHSIYGNWTSERSLSFIHDLVDTDLQYVNWSRIELLLTPTLTGYKPTCTDLETYIVDLLKALRIESPDKAHELINSELTRWEDSAKLRQSTESLLGRVIHTALNEALSAINWIDIETSLRESR